MFQLIRVPMTFPLYLERRERFIRYVQICVTQHGIRIFSERLMKD